MKKVLFGIFLFLQIALLIVLVFTRFIPVISPGEYGVMGVFGLFTPLLAMINIFFLLLWLFWQKYWLLLASFLGFVVSWNVLSVCFAFNVLDRNEFATDSTSFNIMSYNVRLLDLYDWTGDKQNREKLLSFVKKEQPDVLCMQEFFSKANTRLDNVEIIKKMGNYPYHAECNIKQYKNRIHGSVVFSKYPILKNETILINEEDKNLIQECYIKINDKVVRVFNVHLHSNKLSSGQLKFDSDGKISEMTNKAIAQSKSIFYKLTEAYEQRGSEVNLSAYIIEADAKTPTIVCGDFNDLPSSYSYFNMRSNMKDAFLEKGVGVGVTYNGNISFLRIDYIFYQEQMRLNGFKRIKVPYSDHYPLKANFTLLN